MDDGADLNDDPPAEPIAPDEPVILADEAFGLQDQTWDDEAWRGLLESQIEAGFFTWQDVATLALGQANPPQVGTSIASKKTFQANHPAQDGVSTMQQVLTWLYAQDGTCVEPHCGSRLDLQVDHVAPIEEAIEDPAQVDVLTNLVLRCRRHNVIRRKSHKLGGKTYLTAESALMWILLQLRPRTRVDFTRMCRLYGMTMSNIRMDEAWAMAVWLARDEAAGFDIAADDEPAVVLRWPDSALTRRRPDDPHPDGATVLDEGARADQLLTFITRTTGADGRYRIHQMPVGYLPFSHYELGGRPGNALCVLSQQPKADEVGNLIALPLLPPAGRELVAWTIHEPGMSVVAQYKAVGGRKIKTFEPSTSRMERVIDKRPAEVIGLIAG